MSVIESQPVASAAAVSPASVPVQQSWSGGRRSGRVQGGDGVVGQSDRTRPPRLFPKDRVDEYACGGQYKERNTGIGGGEMHNQRYGVSWAFKSKGGRERDRCVRQYHARGVWGPWGPAGDGGDSGVSQPGAKVPPWMDSCPGCGGALPDRPDRHSARQRPQNQPHPRSHSSHEPNAGAKPRH